MLEEPAFRPDLYTERGYVSRGSILSDGFGLYLSAFKLRELQSVRYRRFPDDQLSPRISPAVGGTDYSLQEIRYVIRTKEDLENLWPEVDPRKIKVLALDAGQAYVVGAYAHLPEDPNGHYNLAVNQKAVMQAVFRYRKWLKQKKQPDDNGRQESIADLESRLPPLRSPASSIANYRETLEPTGALPYTDEKHKEEPVEGRLLEIYNGSNNRFKKHTWDQERAKKAEYQAFASSLLRIVGGDMGRPRDPDNPVLMAVGLGQFKSVGRLKSMHSSFLAYFVRLVCLPSR